MHLDGIVFKILLTAATARTAVTPPEGFNSEFIDPATYLNTLAESKTSQTPESTIRTPFDFCLYGENTAPLEEAQADQKHLADLGTTFCVVKAIDRYWYRARLTGRDQGRIMATNFHPEGRDVASFWLVTVPLPAPQIEKTG